MDFYHTRPGNEVGLFDVIILHPVINLINYVVQYFQSTGSIVSIQASRLTYGRLAIDKDANTYTEGHRVWSLMPPLSSTWVGGA